jgi:hypothetical protein
VILSVKQNSFFSFLVSSYKHGGRRGVSYLSSITQLCVHQAMGWMNIRRDGTEIKFSNIIPHEKEVGGKGISTPLLVIYAPRWKRNLNNCDINIMKRRALMVVSCDLQTYSQT